MEQEFLALKITALKQRISQRECELDKKKKGFHISKLEAWGRAALATKVESTIRERIGK